MNLLHSKKFGGINPKCWQEKKFFFYQTWTIFSHPSDDLNEPTHAIHRSDDLKEPT